MINPIGFAAEGSELFATAKAGAAPSGSFANWLGRELESVNRQLNVADTNLQKLATGEADNLHQVMLSLSKAKLQFELVVQVRNKLLEGYQEIMRMQV